MSLSTRPSAHRRALMMLCAATFLPLAGCPFEELAQNPAALGRVAPDVTTSPVELRRRPDFKSLGAYYCPRVIDSPILALGCAATLGVPPARSELVFELGLTFTFANPNDVPVPALDVLLAVTLFDGEPDAEALGAICVSLCGTDDPTCDGSPRPGACESSSAGVTGIGDFIDLVPDLIEGLASGQLLDDLRNTTIAAGGELSLDLSFQLGIDQALVVFQKTALRWVEDMLSGGSPQLDVPIAAEGTVFFQVPLLGRIGVGFGPLGGTWTLR